MNILDIVGPVMVGPSSSHTAGAVRIGQTAGRLLGEKVAAADIRLHGSFWATGKGHGTDRAIVAGLLGFAVDDPRIPNSFQEAQRAGMRFVIGSITLLNAHPNSVRLQLTGQSGRTLEVIGSSIGGGRICINEIDGLTANFSGEAPTLVVYNQDKPGCIVKVTRQLEQSKINVATMQVYRDERGGHAVMVIEVDQAVPAGCIAQLEREDGIEKVIYL
ncbi:MAG: L-serine ammonia-lyase, iron-sulfur-dependent subunit beta [Eubacteriales bacterium]|nr:L-serine ammonia-lyase, iron-sulfur-dependent subunit beta [Eubacteriales bacterium]